MTGIAVGYLIVEAVLLSPLLSAGSILRQIGEPARYQEQKNIYESQKQSGEAPRSVYTRLGTSPLDKKPDSASAPCVKIYSIDTEAITLISRKDLRKVTSAYLHRCDTMNDLANLLKSINNIYIEKAYVTSIAYIKPQDLSDGTLVISAMEGRIEAVEGEGVNTRLLFPGAAGSFLNLRDIEAVITQLNRLRSRSSSVQIDPGNKTGYSRILVKSERLKSGRVYKKIGRSGGFLGTGLGSHDKYGWVPLGVYSKSREIIGGVGSSITAAGSIEGTAGALQNGIKGHAAALPYAPPSSLAPIPEPPSAVIKPPALADIPAQSDPLYNDFGRFINGSGFLDMLGYDASDTMRSIEASFRSAPPFSLIGAGHLALNTLYRLDNAGAIYSLGDMRLNSSGVLANTGGTIASSGDMRLSSSGNMLNLSGDVKARSVLMRSAGDLLIGTLKEAHRFCLATSCRSSQTAGAAASVVSEEGSVLVTADGDISVKGAKLDSVQDLDLFAKGALEIASLKLNGSYSYAVSDSSGSGDSTRALGSSLRAAGTLGTYSGDDTLIEASSLDAKSMDLESGGSLYITAALESAHDEHRITGKRLLSSYSSSQSRLDETLKRSFLLAENIEIGSKGDIGIEASDIRSKESLLVRAGGDLTLRALEQRSFSAYEEHESFLGDLLGSLESGRDESTRLFGASVRSGGSADIEARSIMVAGSALSAQTVELGAKLLRLIDLKESDTHSLHTDSSGVLLRVIHDEGYIRERPVRALIEAEGELLAGNSLLRRDLSAEHILSSDTLLSELNGMQIERLRATLRSREWNETHRMLSKMGTLIVQAITTLIAPEIGTGLVNSVFGEAAAKGILARSGEAALNALSHRVTSALIESAVTGKAPQIDFKGLALSAIGAGVTYGIGHGFGAEWTLPQKTLSHAVVQGALNVARGGEFRGGFAAGVVGKLGGETLRGLGIDGEDGFEIAAGTLLSGAMGGFASELAGGDFTTGALGASMVYLYNELQKAVESASLKKQRALAEAKARAYEKAFGGQAHSYMMDDPKISKAMIAAVGLGIDAFSGKAELELTKDLIKDVIWRKTRQGETAARVLLKNGNILDISPRRVKAYVPHTHPKAPKGTMQKVRFDNTISGTKGYKRLPTKAELDFLKGH